MKKGNVNTSTLKFIFTNKLVASKNCFNLLIVGWWLVPTKRKYSIIFSM